MKFTSPSVAPPREGEWCECLDSQGNVSVLKRQGTRWLSRDGTHVDSTPSMWRYREYPDYH